MEQSINSVLATPFKVDKTNLILPLALLGKSI